MLLSEVLYIAKNLKNYKLNEGLKSKTLRDLLRPFSYSNLTLNPRFHHQKYSFDDMEKDRAGVSFFDVTFAYQRAAKDGILTQELCDTVEGRSSIINRIYIKKKKRKIYGNSYENMGPIYDIIKIIRIKTGYNIGLSEIQDSQLITISPDDAKKKKYKTGLQFWVNYEDQLVAITIDNSIILYITNKGDYGSWYEPNPDYKEKTDFSDFDTNEKSVEEYVKKAFRKIPVYKILTSNVDIKNELGANNIKALQANGYIYKVYVVNPDYMSSIDTTQKLQTRTEWRAFLQSQLNLASKNIQRYKQQIKLNKTTGDDSKIIKGVSNFSDICFDVLQKVQDFEFDYLSKDAIDFHFENSYCITVELTGHKYQDALKKIDNFKVFQSERRGPYNSRHKYKVDIFSIDSVTDCFAIVNVYIDSIIQQVQEVIIRYNEYKELMNKPDINNDSLLSALSSLKFVYKTLLNQRVYTQDKVLMTALKELKNHKQIDLEKLIKPLEDFNNFEDVNLNTGSIY